jgi:hypothetical protein
MLRRKRFTRFEIALLCFFAALLLVAGVAGIFLAAWQFHWRLASAACRCELSMIRNKIYFIR